MNLTYNQLIKDMDSCEQTKGMSVLEHGSLVSYFYGDLITHLRDNDKLEKEWKMPEWIYTHKDLILSHLLDDWTMERYHIFHDCGKPYCRTVDEEGKQHFPDHAEVSYQVWNKLFPEDTTIGSLIKKDMVVHGIKSEDLDEFVKDPLAISLLITGLCEIHANATMFGGIDSTSFKIKWKQIDRKGKQILNKLSIS